MTHSKAAGDAGTGAGDEDALVAEQAEDAGTGAGDTAEPGPDIEMLVMERDELKDRLYRALAETENIRKRAERDRRDAEMYGGVKLARDLLSVYDNLGRALAAIDDDLRGRAAALVEGLELTQRELINAFARHKIEKVEPQPGERFDPNRHQALFEAPVPGTKAGDIIQVMAEGFVIGERLLRPAHVGVSSGGPAQPPVQ
jgi:molecular chaperone GrpE